MRYSILFIYIAVSILVFFFNWNLFTTFLEIDLVFVTISTLPFFILQIFGAVILAAYMLWDRMKDLKREVLITGLQKEIIELQKNSEITALKTATTVKDFTSSIQDTDADKDLVPQS